MRGHAIAERLQVGFERLPRQVRFFQGCQVVCVEMEPLATCDQFGTTEEQVEGV